MEFWERYDKKEVKYSNKALFRFKLFCCCHVVYCFIVWRRSPWYCYSWMSNIFAFFDLLFNSSPGTGIPEHPHSNSIHYFISTSIPCPSFHLINGNFRFFPLASHSVYTSSSWVFLLRVWHLACLVGLVIPFSHFVQGITNW